MLAYGMVPVISAWGSGDWRRGIVLLLAAFILLANLGTSFGGSSNLFIKRNNDLYAEGWYKTDSDGNLTGLLTIDFINKSPSALTRISIGTIPGFTECSLKPDNWTCEYDSAGNVLSFVVNSGTFTTHDSASFMVNFKKPGTKKLSDGGFIEYENAAGKSRITGIPALEASP